MRDNLHLLINGRPVDVRGDEAFETLSDFLRRRSGLTGTKVVCAEGDCGACAVLIGRLQAATNQLEYSSVCSCILRMFQLDATHIVTIEGLKNGDNLNPIQESMVKCHGAQCGFCTPGMVVSLYDAIQHEGKLTANSARRGLVGNLCRCTGYDSIIRAAVETDTSKLKPLDRDASPLKDSAAEEVSITTDQFRFFKPTSLPSALKFRHENPACLIVAGATDLGVQCNKGTRQLSVVMSTLGLPELNTISGTEDALLVGGGATLTQLEKITTDSLPELSRFLAYFGSPLIKNAGTLAGNLVNGSPIADTVPALFALDAEIQIASTEGSRWVNIHQFYNGYRKTVLTPRELVTNIRIPLPDKSDTFKLYKVSRRKDLDIASFGAAVWMRRNGIIDDVRIAYGGVAPTVVRVPAAEALLRGKTATLELFEEAGRAARAEVSPITDVRGSSDYRLALAENILVKFWHDLSET